MYRLGQATPCQEKDLLPVEGKDTSDLELSLQVGYRELALLCLQGADAHHEEGSETEDVDQTDPSGSAAFVDQDVDDEPGGSHVLAKGACLHCAIVCRFVGLFVVLCSCKVPQCTTAVLLYHCCMYCCNVLWDPIASVHWRPLLELLLSMSPVFLLVDVEPNFLQVGNLRTNLDTKSTWSTVQSVKFLDTLMKYYNRIKKIGQCQFQY